MWDLMTQVPPVRATRPDFGNPFESFCSPHLAIIALDNPGCGLKEADLIVKSGKRLGGGEAGRVAELGEKRSGWLFGGWLTRWDGVMLVGQAANGKGLPTVPG